MIDFDRDDIMEWILGFAAGCSIFFGLRFGFSKKWIQKAVKRKGRVKRYLQRKYGSKAFFEDGDIKIKYLNKAIDDIGETKQGSKKHSLKMALVLAKRFARGIE